MAFAYLEHGSLVEVNTESIILAENQDRYECKSTSIAVDVKFVTSDVVVTHSSTKK